MEKPGMGRNPLVRAGLLAVRRVPPMGPPKTPSHGRPPVLRHDWACWFGRIFCGASGPSGRPAKNRAIRSNFCPSGAKIPLLSLARSKTPDMGSPDAICVGSFRSAKTPGNRAVLRFCPAGFCFAKLQESTQPAPMPAGCISHKCGGASRTKNAPDRLLWLLLFLGGLFPGVYARSPGRPYRKDPPAALPLYLRGARPRQALARGASVYRIPGDGGTRIASLRDGSAGRIRAGSYLTY
jgi:hypothetical protein